MARAPTPLPRWAVRLGFLGLAPLAVSAIVSLSRHADTAHLGALAFSIYAAALLSFLGGVRCGIEMHRAPDAPDPLRLAFSSLPALAGWLMALFVIVFPVGASGGPLFSGLFAAQYAWDHRSAQAGAPAWYPMLRQVLTGGAMIICLIAPLAGALRRF